MRNCGYEIPGSVQVRLERFDSVLLCRCAAKATRVSILLTTFMLLLGCSKPYSGNWTGTRVPSKAALIIKQKGYSETKPSMTSTLQLNNNGSYSAKLQQVDYTGDWSADGGTITLTPTSYMGMDKGSFPKAKDGSSMNLGALFAPYVLSASKDGSTLVHTDNLGVVTYKKSN